MTAADFHGSNLAPKEKSMPPFRRQRIPITLLTRAAYRMPLEYRIASPVFPLDSPALFISFIYQLWVSPRNCPVGEIRRCSVTLSVNANRDKQNDNREKKYRAIFDDPKVTRVKREREGRAGLRGRLPRPSSAFAIN